MKEKRVLDYLKIVILKELPARRTRLWQAGATEESRGGMGKR
jgi:hypothetical protein